VRWPSPAARSPLVSGRWSTARPAPDRSAWNFGTRWQPWLDRPLSCSGFSCLLARPLADDARPELARGRRRLRRPQQAGRLPQPSSLGRTGLTRGHVGPHLGGLGLVTGIEHVDTEQIARNIVVHG